MEALLTSTAVVALAEIGDKTQLLAILLATRFRKPVPIIFGILVATLANHACAAFLGATVASIFQNAWFHYLVALSFIAMALWTLIPDKLDDLKDSPARFGAFLTTTMAFFLVEMGDKTQLATVALAARYHSLASVVAGTTVGMLVANVPAVWMGEALTHRIDMRRMRWIAAALFLGLAVLTLLASDDAVRVG